MPKGGGEGGLTKDELIAQLTTELRQSKADLEAEVKERKKLERESERQQKQCNDLEASLTSDRDKHATEIELLESEHKSYADAVAHELESARHKTKTLEHHLAAYDDMEQESTVLRARAAACMEQLQKEGVDHAEKEHKLKKEMFNLRMQLEQTFRKSLQDLDAKYQKQAFESMNEEAKNALIANAHMTKELALQSVGVEHFMQRFTAQGKENAELKRQAEIVTASNRECMRRAARAKKQGDELQARIYDMQESMRSLVAGASASHSVADTAAGEAAAGAAGGLGLGLGVDLDTELSALQATVEAQKDENRQLKGRCKKWKARALKMTQQIASQNAAEQKAEALQARVAISLASVASVGDGDGDGHDASSPAADTMADSVDASVYAQDSGLVSGGQSLLLLDPSVSMASSVDLTARAGNLQEADAEDVRAIWNSSYRAGDDDAGTDDAPEGGVIVGAEEGLGPALARRQHAERAKAKARRSRQLMKTGGAVLTSAEIKKRYFVPC